MTTHTGKKQSFDFVPLLETKLYIPAPRSDLVVRSRLLDQLNQGFQKRLTLLSAPAGFGKTTLISHWIHHQNVPRAWLSIDKTDSDPVSFLTYLTAALRSLDKSVGTAALNLIQSPQRPPLESILINLINDIVYISDEFVLVLDDYHLAAKEPVHRLLAFLVEHMPPPMHLILATRSDPPLPLARLRSQNQIIELRAQDLCFSMSEATIFFHKMMRLELSKDDITVLESRTEGWIAGLQLAALSMQNREDFSTFVQAFKGDNRYIADYLMEEVLNQQSGDVQDFLLRTSILERLSGSLCDMVLSRKDSCQVLRTLERANLFLFPMDQEHQWFRYHRLFADLLRQRLHQSLDSDIRDMYHKASIWTEQNGFKEESVEYALAAEDYTKAANLIEDIAEIDWDRGRESQLLNWLKTLPEKLLLKSPQLNIFFARELFESGYMESAENHLCHAEILIKQKAVGKSAVTPKIRKSFDGLHGRIAAIRAIMASHQGDISRIIEFTQQALELLPREDLMWRSVAATTQGFAYGWSGEGDMKKALNAFSKARNISDSAGNSYYYLFSTICCAGILALQGRIGDAEQLYNESLKLAREKNLLQTGIGGSIYTSLGGIFVSRNEVEEGIQNIEKGILFSERGMDPIVIAAGRLQLMRAHFSTGNIAGTQNVISDLEKRAKKFPIPPWMVHVIEAYKGWVLLFAGDLKGASRWVESRSLSVGDPLSQRREAEYHVFARILSAQEKFSEADKLLCRLIKNGEAGERWLTIHQFHLDRALNFYTMDMIDEAVEALKKAIAFFESEGIIRNLVMEGEPVAELLELLLEEKQDESNTESAGFSRGYIKKILLAFQTEKGSKLKQTVDDKLSDRELDVLRLIAAGFSNQEVADRLFISLNTVRTHTKNIHSKLDVHSRTQAIARAKEKGLL